MSLVRISRGTLRPHTGTLRESEYNYSNKTCFMAGFKEK